MQVRKLRGVGAFSARARGSDERETAILSRMLQLARRFMIRSAHMAIEPPRRLKPAARVLERTSRGASGLSRAGEAGGDRASRKPYQLLRRPADGKQGAEPDFQYPVDALVLRGSLGVIAP